MKSYKLLFRITFRHLISKFKQTAIASFGVMFGIGTFITMVGFMTGLNGLLDGLVLNRTPHIHLYNEIKPSTIQPVHLSDRFGNDLNKIYSIRPKESQTKIYNALPIIQYLKNDERVKGVTPQVAAKVFYISGSIELNGIINGIDADEEVRLFNFEDYIVEGSSSDLQKISNSILVGSGIAQTMSLKIGDKIKLSSPTGVILPLKIVGIFQSGLAEIDNIQSYVNIKTAQQLLGKNSNYISDINIKLWDINTAPIMAKQLSRQFNITALDIQQANAQFDTGTSIRNLITYAVSITLLLVAGFGIYNILNMMIYEKMNDIAILKATGFTGNDVMMIFISQALIIGLIGGILGLILGYGLSLAISKTPFNTDALPTIDTYPVNFDPVYYTIGILFAICATFLAGYLPSIKAKNIDPVRIIKNQ